MNVNLRWDWNSRTCMLTWCMLACAVQVRVLDVPAMAELEAVQVRLPHASVLQELQPFTGDPVGSLLWLGATGQGQALLTGSQGNEGLRLWHLGGQGLQLRQSLHLPSPSASHPVRTPAEWAADVLWRVSLTHLFPDPWSVIRADGLLCTCTASRSSSCKCNCMQV